MNRTPAIVGFLIAGAITLALGFFLGGRESGGDDAAPALRILAPADGDSVRNPVSLVFATPAELESGPAGWMAGDLHLHAMIDGTEYMPAAADITVADSAFTWRLPRLTPGVRRIHLTWAARHHGNIAGPTDTVHIVIRP